ncbi:MAG: hypothetical protein JSR82_06760 [Verrucomicrobia bacterium]|nr:hypothetical protein [Verrucomicrobiota bacterium]
MDNDSNSPAPSTGLAPNVSCLLSWLFGIIFFFIEKNHQPSRWWAKQSIVLFVIAIAWNILAQILAMIGLGLVVGLLGIVIGLGFLAIGIFGIIKSWSGQAFDMPVLAPLARQYLPKD